MRRPLPQGAVRGIGTGLEQSPAWAVVIAEAVDMYVGGNCVGSPNCRVMYVCVCMYVCMSNGSTWAITTGRQNLSTGEPRPTYIVTRWPTLPYPGNVARLSNHKAIWPAGTPPGKGHVRSRCDELGIFISPALSIPIPQEPDGVQCWGIEWLSSRWAEYSRTTYVVPSSTGAIVSGQAVEVRGPKGTVFLSLDKSN